jgi:hypothetical protein
MLHDTICVPICITGYEIKDNVTSSCALGVFTSAECGLTASSGETTVETFETLFQGAIVADNFEAQLKQELQAANNASTTGAVVTVEITKYEATTTAAFTLPVDTSTLESPAARTQLKTAIATAVSDPTSTASTISADNVMIIGISDPSTSGRRLSVDGIPEHRQLQTASARVDYEVKTANKANKVAKLTSDTASFASTLATSINAAGSVIPSVSASSVTADTPVHKTQIEYTTRIVAPVGTIAATAVDATVMISIQNRTRETGTPEITQAPTTTTVSPLLTSATPTPANTSDDEFPLVGVVAGASCGFILLLVLSICCLPGDMCDACRDKVGVGGCVIGSNKGSIAHRSQPSGWAAGDV